MARPPDIAAILATLRRRLRGATAVLAAGLLAVGCSTLPSGHYPPFAEYCVQAEYQFAGGAGERRVAVPATDDLLTVLDLQVEPAPLDERFQDGRRWLLLPPDCDHVTVRCRYRDYCAHRLGAALPPDGLFPDAQRLRWHPERMAP